MEYTDYTVRADFYPDGDIIPLGITDSHGNSYFVNRIIEIMRTGDRSICFKCSTIGNGVFLLSFSHDRWTVCKVQN